MLHQQQVRIPSSIRHQFGCSDRVLDELDRFLASSAVSTIEITAHRVSSEPLRRSFFSRILGREPATPLLSPTASKWCGTPYAEGGEDWKGARFLCQLNFEEIRHVSENPELPKQGILGLDDIRSRPNSSPLRTRWYPSPSADKSVFREVPSIGTYEAEMAFGLGWSLPEGPAWSKELPTSAGMECQEAWEDWYGDGIRTSAEHRVGGRMPEGLRRALLHERYCQELWIG